MRQRWWQKKSKIFAASLMAWLLAFLVAPNLPNSLWNFGFYFFLVALILLVSGFLVDNYKWKTGLFVVGFFILAGWRFALMAPVINNQHIAYYNDQEIEAIVEIQGYPDYREAATVLTLKVKELNKINKIKGKIIVWTKRWPEYQPGDVLAIKCKLQTPKVSGEFRYDRYLAARGVYSVCYSPEIKKLEHHNNLLEHFYNLRMFLAEKINEGLTDPEAGLAEAMTLGLQSSVSAKWLDIYTKTGVVHMISVSGFHMSLISVIIIWILLAVGVNRKTVFWPAVSFLIFYTLLVGAPAAAVRSAVMAGMVLWAVYLGRVSQLGIILLLAGSLMALINPWLVSADIGFQLSFLSVFGLIYLTSIIEKWLLKIMAKIKLQPRLAKILAVGVGATIATQMSTFPLVAGAFGGLSIIALVANLLLGAVSAWWLGMILATLVVASIRLIPVEICFFPVNWVGKLITGLAYAFAKVPLAYLNNLVLPNYFGYLWYGLIIFIIIRFGEKN